MKKAILISLFLLATGLSISPIVSNAQVINVLSRQQFNFSNQSGVSEQVNVPMKGNQWYLSGNTQVVLTNSTGSAIDLTQVPIRLSGVQGSIKSNVWSFCIGKNRKWYGSEKQSNQDYFVKGATLLAGQSIHFALNLSESGQDLKPRNINVGVAIGKVVPPNQAGQLDVTFQGENTGVSAPGSAIITLSGSELKKPLKTKVTNFNQPLIYKGLHTGRYTISASKLPQNYTLKFSQANINIPDSKIEKVTGYYNAINTVLAKSLTVTLPQQPIQSTAHVVVPKSVAIHVNQQARNLAWSNSVTLNNLAAGSYLIQGSRITNGISVYGAKKNINIQSNTRIDLNYSKLANVSSKSINFKIEGLAENQNATIELKTKAYDNLEFKLIKLQEGENQVIIPTGTYQVSVDAVNGKTGRAVTFNTAKNTTEIVNFKQIDNAGQIYYHLTFPVNANNINKGAKLVLNKNYTNLIMSNFVSGAMYAHLIHEHFPEIKINDQYIEGSLLGQLLQENIETSAYKNASPWINPSPTIRAMLLAPGQGGPYQINDYSKKLEDNLGLINFTVLQKNLGYTIQSQDNGTQTRRKGPESLDNKYFGPLAAAYFQYNDLLRLQAINSKNWGPSAKYFSAALENARKDQNNFLDMIMNAAYNAGPWADITKTYIKLGANENNPTYASKIKNIDNYNLTDAEYQKAIGTKEAVGTTFIIYPRQIRFYLDQLYNNRTHTNVVTHNNLVFPISELKQVFSDDMATLAYVNPQQQYSFIPKDLSNKAFDAALKTLDISIASDLSISQASSRMQVFSLLNNAIDNLAKELGPNFKFNETTNKNH